MNKEQFTWWYERVFSQSPSLCALKYDDEKMWEAWKAAKQWQGLSDDDMSIIFNKFDFNECQIAGEYLDLLAFARAIEQKLKEKNE